MSKQILILGGGTAGTLLANRLRRDLPPDDLITVVDGDADHLYQPGLLFVPFGAVRPERLTRVRERQFHRGIAYRQCAVDHADIEARRVYLEDGSVLDYDVLVVATGAALLPDETTDCPTRQRGARPSRSTISLALWACATRWKASPAGGSW